METLLTSREVAEGWKIPVGTLNQWAYRKVGPPFLKVGRHRRYRARDIERWLEEQTVGGAA